MKRLSTLALVLLLPILVLAATSKFKFTNDGEFASASGNFGPDATFNLNVSRGFSTGTGTAASINYLASSTAPDFSTVTFTQITGSIPAGAFTGSSTQRLTLNLSTDQLDPTTSTSQSCVIDTTALTVTCGPAPTGTISLDFHENGAVRTRILAFSEEIIVGNTTTHIHQRSDNSTANVTGTIFGTDVSGATATVGINHSSTIEVEQN